MRLLDAEDLSSLRLGKFPLFDHAVYLQRQACLKKLLVRIGETKVLSQIHASSNDQLEPWPKACQSLDD